MHYRFWGLLDSCLAAKEKITVIIVIENNPTIKIIYAHRSKRNVEFSNRIDKNDRRELIINNTLSTAKALSIKKLTASGGKLLTILITIVQTPTIVAEFGKI
jgi:hypothetical protein